MEFDTREVGKDVTLSLFGIEMKNKVCLNNVKFKNVTVKCRKLE